MKGRVMKKTVLVLAVLMLAVPVMAGVRIDANQVGTTKVVQVSYIAADGNIPRAFALDVRISEANDANVLPYGFNQNYYVAPGTFTYIGGVTVWGNPAVGPNTVGFTTEMGSLWATNDPCGHIAQPPSTGVLFSFKVDHACTVTLTENSQRGGVVMEKTDGNFPAGYVTLYGTTVADEICTVPNVVNVAEATATASITAAGFTLGARTTACHATIVAGNVISTTPAAGVATCGSAVAYVVSTGVCAPAVPASILYPPFDPDCNIPVWWAASSGATSYDLEVSDNNGVFANVYTGALTYKMNTVLVGKHKYRVRAYNAGGYSGYRTGAVDCNSTLSTCYRGGNTADPNWASWIALGRPDCWCGTPKGSAYQCDGDADGAKFGTWRLYSGDLAILSKNWKATAATMAADPNMTGTTLKIVSACGDVDHKAFGTWRVYSADLAKLSAKWKFPDANFPGNCPR